MLRIAKFKLAEVSRNIKHGQLKPIEKAKKESNRNASLSPEAASKPPKRPPVPAAPGIPKQKAVRTSSQQKLSQEALRSHNKQLKQGQAADPKDGAGVNDAANIKN